MSSRGRRESLRSYEERLQRTLACITTSVITVREAMYQAEDRANHTYSLMLNNAEPAQLRNSSSITLTVREDVVLHHGIVQGRTGWNLRLDGYSYSFRDGSDRDILLFHWHQRGASLFTAPHIHIGAAMIAPTAPLRHDTFHRAHIPTGQVFIEDVVRFAITELHVDPLRPDWDTLLAGIARQRTQMT